MFYLDVTKFSLTTKSVSVGALKTYTVKITPSDGLNYLSKNFRSEKEVNNAISRVESIKKSIINSVSTENTYNKLLKVHNMLVNSIEYDQTCNKPNTHNIYGALVEKQVVCEGYAKAYKYILDSLNIECILVNGSGINSSNETEAHMWNYVKLNGSWYGIDVTWDDPIIIGGYVSNNLRHDYFLKGSTNFIHSHYPSGKISDSGMLFDIPKLSTNDFNN